MYCSLGDAYADCLFYPSIWSVSAQNIRCAQVWQTSCLKIELEYSQIDLGKNTILTALNIVVLSNQFCRS